MVESAAAAAAAAAAAHVLMRFHIMYVSSALGPGSPPDAAGLFHCNSPVARKDSEPGPDLMDGDVLALPAPILYIYIHI